MNNNYNQSRLDELFGGVKSYRSSLNYLEMLRFCRSMKQLAPYNAMLVYMQRPGARYLLNEYKWDKLYHRGIRPQARPVLVLIPFGPLEFLFDIDDTYAYNGENQYPEDLQQIINRFSNPFKTKGKVDSGIISTLRSNLKYFGIALNDRVTDGSCLGGAIQNLTSKDLRSYMLEFKTKNIGFSYPAYYLLSISSKASETQAFATMVHELGHFFCGHLPSPPGSRHWWKMRQGNHDVREFEAESVSWIICGRLGITTSSIQYLSGYCDKHNEIPVGVSIEEIFKAANIVWKLLTVSVELTKSMLYKHDEKFASLYKSCLPQNKAIQGTLF